MIGHYLLTLNEEQEDRVLTQTFGPIIEPSTDALCLCLLVGRASESSRGVLEAELYGGRNRTTWGLRGTRNRMPGHVYEDVCRRFGTPRVNAAIRNRILSNRTRRILQNAPVSRETAGVGERRFAWHLT